MIFSIHIPKTGGTSFRRLLGRRYGRAFASYYGEDRNTDPRLMVRRGELLDLLPALEGNGLQVVHGHMRAKTLLPALRDPSQVWVWLRDPVERVISHYFFLRASQQGGSRAKKIRTGELTLREFAASPRSANLQSQFLEPLEIDRLGFVGLTERYDDCVRLLFGHAGGSGLRIWNRTRVKPEVDEPMRAFIAEANARDVELYAQAKRIVDERLAQLPARKPGLLGALRAGLVRA